MKIEKVVRKRLEGKGDGVDIAGALNVAVAANVNEKGSSRSSISTRQRIVQRGGETVVSEETAHTGERPDETGRR